MRAKSADGILHWYSFRNKVGLLGLELFDVGFLPFDLGLLMFGFGLLLFKFGLLGCIERVSLPCLNEMSLFTVFTTVKAMFMYVILLVQFFNSLFEIR